MTEIWDDFEVFASSSTSDVGAVRSVSVTRPDLEKRRSHSGTSETAVQIIKATKWCYAGTERVVLGRRVVISHSLHSYLFDNTPFVRSTSPALSVCICRCITCRLRWKLARAEGSYSRECYGHFTLHKYRAPLSCVGRRVTQVYCRSTSHHSH